MESDSKDEDKVRKRVKSTVREITRDLKGLFRSSTPQVSTSAAPIINQIPVLPAPKDVVPAQPNESNSHQAATQSPWSKLETGLRGLAKSTSLFPPLRSAIDNLVSCLDVLRAAAETRSSFADLTASLGAIIQDLETHLRDSSWPEPSGCINNIVNGLQREVDYLSDKNNSSNARQYAEALDDENDLMECYRRIELLFQRIQSNAILSVWSIANEQLANTRLESMQPAKQARYDSSMAAVLHRRACTPNTRTVVLEDLRAWANNPAGPRIYWMNGMAGTGKTTIAYTFCGQLDTMHQLAASFFCSRELPDCGNSSRIVPTLAYQLARFSRPFQTALCRVLQDDPDISTREITKQFDKLIVQPMEEVRATLPTNLIMVVDALDECDRHDIAVHFLVALLNHAMALPVKFFLTCRPEPALYNRIQNQSTSSRTLFHLHDIDGSIVQADIETYLGVELAGLSEDQASLLVTLSGKLFVFAATAVRYIKPDLAGAILPNRLDTILSASWVFGSKAYQSLDLLYSTILTTAMESLEPLEVQIMTNLLHTVICAKEPLTVGTLASLLDISTNETRCLIEPLGSVLHISKQDSLVSPLHVSFPEYLLNSERSSHFSCNLEKRNESLAVYCFSTMERLLRFNICDLESSYILDRDVQDLPQRISNNLPAHLLYACEYWMIHLCEAGEKYGLIQNLRKFLESQVLFWLEVVNLTDRVNKVVPSMFALHNWLIDLYHSSDLCPIVKDAAVFTTVIANNNVRQSTPHIYISVLGLWDRVRPMWTYYGKKISELIQEKRAVLDHNTLGTLAVWNIPSGIKSIGISQDSTRVIYASDSRVFVVDASTGRETIKISLGYDSVMCAAFSPDNNIIALCSTDHTLYTFNAQSGARVGGAFEHCEPRHRYLPGRCYNNVEDTLAFSLDGTRVTLVHRCGSTSWDTSDTTLPSCRQTEYFEMDYHYINHTSLARSFTDSFLAIGRCDGRIQINDLAAGKLLFGPFLVSVEAKSVTSITFSRDEMFVAAVVGTNTIGVWDIKTGRSRLEFTSVHSITHLAFSPDGKTLVSSSANHTIRIWDAYDGNLLAGPLKGHTKSISTLKVMPDGIRLISASEDATIRIWDVQFGYISEEKPIVKAKGIRVILIGCSSDNTCIASMSTDSEICLWDARAGSMVIGPLKPPRSINWAALSSDGQKVFSANDREIYTWDVLTGQLLNGEPASITSSTHKWLAVSPDGRYSASVSDCCMFLWDTQTTRVLRIIPTGYNLQSVIFLRFTTGDKRLVCGHTDCTVHIWDVYSGCILVGPVQGPTSYAKSMVCSQDGKYIASLSDQETLWIWDAYTGAVLANLLGNCDGRICSFVFSGCGRRVIAALYDHTIWVWDAQSGDKVLGPFKAHSNLITSMVLSPDGCTLASCDTSGCIFVWKFHSDSWYIGDDVSGWIAEDNGWITGPDSERLLWVMPDLRFWLNGPHTSVIHDRGPFGLKMETGTIGTRWKELWTG